MANADMIKLLPAGITYPPGISTSNTSTIGTSLVNLSMLTDNNVFMGSSFVGRDCRVQPETLLDATFEVLEVGQVFGTTIPVRFAKDVA